MKPRTYLTPKSTVKILILLFSLLLFSFSIALLFGSEQLAASSLFLALFNKVFGRPTGLTIETETILFVVRLPRAFFAICAGASLSVAGASLQALLRNPLAEPYVLGVSSGAAVGAIISIIFAEKLSFSQPIGAFTGAVITVFVVYFLGQGKSGTSTERLILAGVITTSFLWAMIIFLLTISSNPKLRGIAFWLMGDLGSGISSILGYTMIACFVAIFVIYLLARMLNLLMVGEESAMSLGVSVEAIKIVLYLLASLLTGLTVAMVGSIGYIGLIVPHIIRMAWSSDHRLLIPAAACLGASLLLLADTVARTIVAPRELPVGAITALIGAPLFVYLLRKTI
ncbi:MAG: iron ABC transporter permease [Blastocatellia bacterium]|nr:iron ABC transporter permease [Blastocatellia bacterium]